MGGSVLGLLFGLLILLISAGAQVTAGINPFSASFDWAMFASSAGIALLAGLILTFLAAFLPTFGTLQSEITQERRTVRRVEQPPFWKRAYLDVILLVAAAVVLAVTQLNGGFKPTGNEGAAISLSFYIFFLYLLFISSFYIYFLYLLFISTFYIFLLYLPFSFLRLDRIDAVNSASG